ncbi:MAG TPA: ABC transporter substrate-binding protein, partial [Anaerolineae bacterium]|nr:ABC transporter substrate-binding protein [Anaerolineae bacterium]
MNLQKKGLLVAAFLLMSMLLAACAAPEAEVVEVEVTRVITETEIVEVAGESVEVEVTRVVTTVETQVVEVEKEDAMPVTLNINWGTEPPALDPSLATDSTSVDVVGNLFVGLTKFNPITGEVEPYLATEWSTNEDGTIYTFKLRDDIPWVKYDPVSGETMQMMDADGNPEFVDAYDIEYGVKRTINPETASDYSYVLYILKNAQAVNSGEEGFTLDDVGVRAVDSTTVEFEL